jgi:hypothetical protein
MAWVYLIGCLHFTFYLWISCAILSIGSWMQIKKNTRYALPFLITSLLFIVAHIQYMFHRYNITNGSIIHQHFVPIILALDCLIIGGIVAATFLEIQEDNQKLSFRLIQKESEIKDRIAEIQIRELSRISQLLHNHRSGNLEKQN